MADPIVIIGAGIGGLSAAIRLRQAGREVLIFEKNPMVGGKMYQHMAHGFRWDTGPSVITMRHVFEELFASAGRRMEDYLTLLPVEPLTRYFFPDGTRLDATSNLTQMIQQIEQINPHDAEGYLHFLAYAARIHRITGPVFIYDHPPTLRSFARVPIFDWLKADPLRTMQGAIDAHVRSSHLRQLLGRFATYVGGSPFVAPATLNVIAHVELSGGVWYPQGGIYRIAEALATLAQELGVTLCIGQPVQQIIVENRRAQGVILEDGTSVRASAVLANSDVTTTLHHLTPQASIPEKHRQQLGRYEPSCSGFVMLLGVDKTDARLAHHNIFFSNDYRAEFEAIFRQGLPPDDPTIYVAITSRSDASHAPPGTENWFVLVNAPAIGDNKWDWVSQGQAYGDRILNRLAVHGFDVREHIRYQHLLTPIDLQNMSGAWRGALYGPSANSKWTVFLRPHNRSQHIRGLYFAGGTTHPGGGVPMVMLSGKVASEMILADGH